MGHGSFLKKSTIAVPSGYKVVGIVVTLPGTVSYWIALKHGPCPCWSGSPSLRTQLQPATGYPRSSSVTKPEWRCLPFCPTIRERQGERLLANPPQTVTVPKQPQRERVYKIGSGEKVVNKRENVVRLLNKAQLYAMRSKTAATTHPLSRSKKNQKKNLDKIHQTLQIC